jgi:hypothetical protein
MNDWMSAALCRRRSPGTRADPTDRSRRSSGMVVAGTQRARPDGARRRMRRWWRFEEREDAATGAAHAGLDARPCSMCSGTAILIAFRGGPRRESDLQGEAWMKSHGVQIHVLSARRRLMERLKRETRFVGGGHRRVSHVSKDLFKFFGFDEEQRPRLVHGTSRATSRTSKNRCFIHLRFGPHLRRITQSSPTEAVGGSLFGIHRDVRFSDKSPYRLTPAFGSRTRRRRPSTRPATTFT